MTQPQALTQMSYTGTPYEDQSWEVIGEFAEEVVFESLEFPIVDQAATMSDPMFADFGGRLQRGEPSATWSNSEGMATAARVREAKEEVVVELSEEVKDQYRQEGYQAGAAETEQRLQAEYASKKSEVDRRLQEVMNDLSAQVSENLEGLERQTIELVIAISEKILHHTVEINPEYIGKIVHEALTYAGSATIKEVRVSTQDMEFLNVVGIQSLDKVRGSEWSFKGDETIKAGCVVETSAGELDFKLESAWERMKNQIIRVIK
jgi:flagellar biosynthesis/type III secretory pathway protein FliH